MPAPGGLMLFLAVTELTCFDGPSRNAPFAPFSLARGVDSRRLLRPGAGPLRDKRCSTVDSSPTRTSVSRCREICTVTRYMYISAKGFSTPVLKVHICSAVVCSANRISRVQDLFATFCSWVTHPTLSLFDILLYPCLILKYPRGQTFSQNFIQYIF
jgi:hypothetical protein